VKAHSPSFEHLPPPAATSRHLSVDTMSSSSLPSNYSKVAGVLFDRGFAFSSLSIDEVIANSSSISFEEEWTKFIDVVQHITGFTPPLDDDATIASEGMENDVDAMSANASQARTMDIIPEGASNATSAWNYFKHVIDAAYLDQQITNPEPAKIGQHDVNVNVARLERQVIDRDSANLGQQCIDPISANSARGGETSFNVALFEALRSSLNGYVVETVDANWIVLKNSIIGFGRNIKRVTFGFKDNYALSRDSESDHSCFVLGKEALGNLKLLNVLESAVNSEEAFFWYNDMTATVELKLEKSSCDGFTVVSNYIKNPTLERSHGPLGQAIMYSMDTWHCLARRGVSGESLPVVLLAGKRKSLNAGSKKVMVKSRARKYKVESLDKKKKARGRTNKEDDFKSSRTKNEGKNATEGKICCLEAHVQIPQYFGEKFTYSIDRIISFNGTTGLAFNEEGSDEESRDMRAIAVYIKTMRFGLENASMVVANRHTVANPILPLSLCCRNFQDGLTDAQLIASPIPREDHQINLGFEISQGEIFQLKNPTKNLFSWFYDYLWFPKIIDDNLPLTDDCLVKVSCAAVHNFYVHPSKSNDALKDLFYKGDPELKTKISEVLLGYYYRDDSTTAVSIMKDLRTEGKLFCMLEHRRFCNKEKLLKLWEAFCGLVKSLLLPMADINVIHFDIRSSNHFTYNILVFEGENEIELCLIDFDSVILSSAASKVDQTEQKEAICWTMPGFEFKTAYQYLFWQVLWIVYRWHASAAPDCELIDSQQEKPNSQTFVSHLFKDDDYVAFKYWLGDHANTLKTKSSGNISREVIENSLEDLTKVFQEKSPQKE
jgi:hypothetical protein